MKRVVIEGVIQGNERGYGFLIPTDPTIEDFFIPHSDLKGAMHKDLVLCEATYGKNVTNYRKIFTSPKTKRCKG